MKKSIVILSALVLLSVPVMAGWVVEYTDGTVAKYDKGRLSSSSMKKGTMSGMIMDVNTEVMIVISTEKKKYYQGTAEEISSKISGMMKKMKEMMGPGAAAMMGMGSDDGKPTVVKIEKLGSGDEILGKKTEHYSVNVDGEKLEEVWIAPSVKIMSESDNKKLAKMMEAFTSGMGMGGSSLDYTTSKEYMGMANRGFPMKTTHSFGMGIKVTTEVAKLEKKNIPNSAFKVPAGYTKVGFMELSGMGKMMEGLK